MTVNETELAELLARATSIELKDGQHAEAASAEELLEMSSAPGEDATADAEAEGALVYTDEAGRQREAADDGTDDPAAPAAADYDDWADDGLDEVAPGPDDASVGDLNLTQPTGEQKDWAESEFKVAGWASCPTCGSGEADVFADGTARCEVDGTPLARAEAKSGTDYELAEDDFTAELDTKAADLADDLEVVAPALEVLTEMELLQARRVGLEQ